MPKKKAVATETPNIREQCAMAIVAMTIVEQIAAKHSAFSLRELADLMGVGYQTLWDMASDGRLPVMRIGSSIRCDPKTISDYLRARMSA